MEWEWPEVKSTMQAVQLRSNLPPGYNGNVNYVADRLIGVQLQYMTNTVEETEKKAEINQKSVDNMVKIIMH